MGIERAWIEEAMPAKAARFIRTYFDSVEHGLGVEGLDCAKASHRWARHLRFAGFDLSVLQGDYEVAPGRLELHVWIVLGRRSAIFDPTWSQFAQYGEPSAARYWESGATIRDYRQKGVRLWRP
jgi:hypothetical protein